jgi:ketosteroid isomerase-like protein
MLPAPRTEEVSVTNARTVAGIYEAFGTGDVPAILAVLADDVEWEAWESNSAVDAGVPWMIPRHGKDEVVRFFETAAQMKIVDLKVLSMMEGDNQVAVEFVIEADLPAHGCGHYRDEELHLWSFNAEGKVTRLRHYVDTAKHVAAFRH